MHFTKTSIVASALLATTEALTINRAHLRAHREAAKLEVREPEPAVVVVTHTVKKYVKYVKTPPPAKSTPEVVVAAQVQPPPVVTQPAPVPAPVKEEPKKEEPKKEEPKKEETKPAASGGAPVIGGGKRGIAFPGNGIEYLKDFAGKCSWSYNWGTTNPAGAPAGVEFVPMCWAPNDAKCPNWKNAVNDAIGKGSKAVLSFNEPDHPAQANLDPSTAASKHIEYFKDLVGKVQIGSPAITSDAAPGKGISWLKSFVDTCNGMSGGNCPIDFCAVHMYAYASEIGKVQQEYKYLEDFLPQAHAACGGKPLWLTEVSIVTGGKSEVETAFMDKVIPLLESTDYVKKYAFFMAGDHDDSSLVRGHKLTAAGQKYATGY